MSKIKLTYEEYINSVMWWLRKKRALISANYRCIKCKSQIDLQVHHLTYDNLGEEKDEDLIVLCEICHIQEHDRLKLKKMGAKEKFLIPIPTVMEYLEDMKKKLEDLDDS